MGDWLEGLLDGLAALEGSSEQEKIEKLGKLYHVLDLSSPENSKIASQLALDHKPAVDAVIHLIATADPAAEVGAYALLLLRRLTNNGDIAKRLLQEHPPVLAIVLNKLEPREEHANENVQLEALGVLQNLAANPDNQREVIGDSRLLPLLASKLESNIEQVQLTMLGVLQNLAANPSNKREMVGLVSLLVGKLESEPEPVQFGLLKVLNNLANQHENAVEMMDAHAAKLLPLLVAKMHGETLLLSVKIVYSLSCSLENRAMLRVNGALTAVLAEGRETNDLALRAFSTLTLINLFGAEEDSKVLQTDAEMLEEIFDVIGRAMNHDGWRLNSPLLAFRFLSVVEHNRVALWSKYGSGFLTTILAALQRAVDDKDLDAAENAMSTLAQFSNDPKPLMWMRANKPQLDKAIVQLGPFPEAHKTAQFLLLIVDPPKVVDDTSSTKPTIMISYNWNHQAQARIIHSVLESQGYPVWRDEERMKGNIMDAMASAIGESKVVLVLVSSWYAESANCKLECLFANQNKRKLIPVMVEPGYELGINWLGLIFAGALYYDVRRCGVDRTQMELVFRSLLANELEGTPDHTNAPSKLPIPQNESEIRQWLVAFEKGDLIADALAKEEFTSAKDLEMLSAKGSVELKGLLGLSGKQAATLDAALKELF
ncbi:hypothetical protein BASA81_003145 [Batrachochytrium salamandrivorans]|nr:hypothetical protein BASA81_003145 [Batrachochytrium salamandrivorans]